MLENDLGFTIDNEGIGVEECAATVDIFDFAGVAKHGEVAGQVFDNFLPMAAHAVDVNFGRAVGHAKMAGLFGLVDNFSHMENRF